MSSLLGLQSIIVIAGQDAKLKLTKPAVSWGWKWIIYGNDEFRGQASNVITVFKYIVPQMRRFCLITYTAENSEDCNIRYGVAIRRSQT